MRPYILAILAATALGGEASVPRGNLLDDPGFDLGSESWTFESWLTTPEPDRRSPRYDTGAPHSPPRALMLPGGGDSLVSRRYPVLPGRAYVLSVWLRLASPAAAGDACRLFLLSPDWRVGRTVIPVSSLAVDSWRRCAVRITAADAGGPFRDYRNSVYVRLDPLVDLLVDSCQLEEAAEAGPYRPGPQIAIRDARPDRIAPLGAASFQILTAEAPEGARIRLNLTDSDASQRWSSEMAAAAEAPVAVELTRRGVHDLAAELVDAQGRVLATAGHRLLAADPAEPPAPHPLIGIDTSPLSGAFPAMEDAQRLAEGLGAGFARFFFKAYNGGRAGLPTDGEAFLAYAAQALDPAVQRRKTLMTVIGPPADSPISIHRMRKDGSVPDDAVVAAELPALVRQAARIAAAMAGRVSSIEVLNEPNIWLVKGRHGMPPERYARVLAACAPAIRAAAPGMQVAANINGIDHAYVEALLRAGADIDLLTVHPYRAMPENPPIYEDMRRLRRVVDAHRPGLPIVNSELYYCLLDRYSEHEHDRNYATAHEGDLAGRTMQSMLHHWAAEGTPYTLFHPEGTLFRPIVPADVRYGLAYGMVRAAGRVLAGCGRGEELPTHPACRAFLFTRGDGILVAALATRRFATRPAGGLAVPAGCDAIDADGNPLAGPRVPLRYVPLYLRFAAGTAVATARTALAAAAIDGLDFPLAPRFAIDAQGHPEMAVACTGNKPASGTVTVLEAPTSWPRGPVEVPETAPGAVSRIALAPAPAAPLPAWGGGLVRWRGESAGQSVERTERLPALPARRPARAPAIDGDLADWTGASWTALRPSKDFDPRQPRRDDADCSARAALAWDEDGLYLAVDVRDDLPGQAPGDGELFTGDSLQIYVDPAASAAADLNCLDGDDAVWTMGLSSAGMPLAVLERNPGNRYLGEANAETGPDPEVRLAWRRGAAGWQAEVLLPARTLPALRLAAGSRFGISLLVNDNDGAGRKQGATFGPSGSEPFNRPWIWPLAELAPGR